MGNSDVARNFANGTTNGNGSNMFIEGNKIYSYGRHFILAIRRKDESFLLNGDYYSQSTTQHQSIVRSACTNYQEKKYPIIIPFTALELAIHHGNNEFDENIEMMKILEQTQDHTREINYIDPKTKETKTRTEHMLGSVLFEYTEKYYLSSTDSKAKGFRMGYFLVELPKKVKNIDEAIDSLRPTRITKNTPHERQGEFFFVSTDRKDKELKEITPSTINSYFDQTKTSRNNHTANHLAKDSKGNIYAKGRVTHPEHKSVLLGKIWHRVYINKAIRSFGSRGRVD